MTVTGLRFRGAGRCAVAPRRLGAAPFGSGRDAVRGAESDASGRPTSDAAAALRTTKIPPRAAHR